MRDKADRALLLANVLSIGLAAFKGGYGKMTATVALAKRAKDGELVFGCAYAHPKPLLPPALPELYV